MTSLNLLEDAFGRLCHDLSTPLSGVLAALDYLGPSTTGEAASVLRAGAAAMQAKLRLWQAVFGSGTDPMGASVLTTLLQDVWSGGRLTPEASQLDAQLPGNMARTALLGAMVAADALPRGGRVRLAGGSSQVAILPDGRDAAWSRALTSALAGQPVQGSRNVLAPLLVAVSAAGGIRPSLAFGAGPTAGPLILSAG